MVFISIWSLGRGYPQWLDFYSILQWNATQSRLYTITTTIYIHLPPDLLPPAYWTVHGRRIMEKATKWLIHSATLLPVFCLVNPDMASFTAPFEMMWLLQWNRLCLRECSEWIMSPSIYTGRSHVVQKGCILQNRSQKKTMGCDELFPPRTWQWWKSLPFLV